MALLTHLIVARGEPFMVNQGDNASETVLTLLQSGVHLDEITVYSLAELPFTISSVKIGL